MRPQSGVYWQVYQLYVAGEMNVMSSSWYALSLFTFRTSEGETQGSAMRRIQAENNTPPRHYGLLFKNK